MRKQSLIQQLMLMSGVASSLLACNGDTNTTNSSSGTSKSGGGVSVMAANLPANLGNRGIVADHDRRLQQTQNSLRNIVSESTPLIIGYNPLINSMADYQCFNYTTTINSISTNSRVHEGSLSSALSAHLASDLSVKGSVSTYLSGGASLNYAGDSSANSFSLAKTYIYQIRYPLNFSQFSLNATGSGQTSPDQFGLKCGSNVITQADGNVTIFIEVMATSANDSDMYNFKQAAGANINSLVGLAESIGYANSNSSSSANVQVSALVIGGNSLANNILNAVQETAGKECFRTGDSSLCAQWNNDVAAAIQAEQSSIDLFHNHTNWHIC